MDNHDLRDSAFAPDAATDEPASPLNDGVKPPADQKALPELVAWALDNSFTETKRGRHDGWTPERMRTFLEELAVHGVVANAAHAAGMSAKSAYRLRASAHGRAFHLAWEGALVLARRRLADELHARAMNGCIEQVYNANGCIVGERHRYDNRLSIAVLTRLDRQVRDMAEEARVGRAVAQEWEQFLDIVEAGGEQAEAFLAARLPAPPSPARGRGSGRGPVPLPAPAAASEPTILARLARYRKYRAALPEEVATGDLDPAAMADWSEEQWERAEFSGFLARLPRDAWPEAARDEGHAGAESPQQRDLHDLFLTYHPPRPAPKAEEEEDFEGCDVWEDPELGWVTDFPPPEGFAGYEDGEPGGSDYKRELTEEERFAVGVDAETLADEREEELAALRAARDRFFGFAPPAPPLDPPPAPDQS